MNENELADRLHGLASHMPVDLERSAPGTLRRARVRRGVAAFAASVAVVAIVLGGVAVLQVASPSGSDRPDPTVPLTEGPTPAPSRAAFAGVWPETTPEALADAQAQVDDGHQPLRLDPEQTAVMLATNLFGWTYEETDPSVSGDEPLPVVVELRNRSLAPDIPPITVELAQLGRTGLDGVWSVVSVSSPLVHPPVEVDAAADGGQASITFSGTLAEAATGSAVRFEVLRGPVSEAGAIAGEVSVVGRTYSGSAGSWPEKTFHLGDAVLWIHVVDPVERTLGATAVPLAGTDGTPVPARTPAPAPDFTDLPPDVAVTAQRILDAAAARDVDALAELVDPALFSYNLGNVSDPVAAWREDPSVLDPIPAVLALPSFEQEVEGTTYHVWPYLMADGALDEISEQERADLRELGFADGEIEQMVEFGGYLGPRLAIDQTGGWRYYVTGGD